MCGIVASVNYSFDTNTVNRVMGHRGPDERNSYQSKNVLLHHLRLSILDVAGGKQPMQYLNRYTIIFNGEIYNHLDVRKQLSLSCITHSDTETLLQAYHTAGADMLSLLDGMFAFIIYDEQENELFIARDRSGKKPLYYYKAHEQLLLASELNCLKALMPLALEEDAIAGFLRTGYMLGNTTPYQKVHEVPKGSWMKVNCTNLQATNTNWWNIKDFYTLQTSISFQEAVAQTDVFLKAGVKRRLESSDIEVGAFLSGGIDSGLVTAMAAGYTKKLKTFTVAFEGAYNEAPLAKLVAEKYATDHTELNIDFSNLSNEIETIIAQYGEPFFDNSCIPSYYVSKEARKHVTVILNGDGADELFGGYRRYVPFAQYNFYRKNSLVNATASFIHQLLPVAHEKKSRYNYIHRLISMAAVSGYQTFLRSGTDIFEQYEQCLKQPFPNSLKNFEQGLNEIFALPISALQKSMMADFEVGLYNMLLVKMDIATMAHSLEGRSPFLCKELLEFAPALPDDYKINGSTTKYLLRQLAKTYLPETLLNQPKRGFEIPLKKWINGNLKQIIHDYIRSTNALWPNFIDQSFIYNLLDEKVKLPAEKRAKMLWAVFCLEVWHKQCVLHS